MKSKSILKIIGILLAIIAAGCVIFMLVVFAGFGLATHEWSNPSFYRLALADYKGEPSLPKSIPKDASDVIFRYHVPVLQGGGELLIGFRSESANELIAHFFDFDRLAEDDYPTSCDPDEIRKNFAERAVKLFGAGDFEVAIGLYEGDNHGKCRVAAIDRERGIVVFSAQKW